MSKKRKHHTQQKHVAHRQTPQQHVTRRPYPYIRWGIISLIGALILLTIQAVYTVSFLQSGKQGDHTLAMVLTTIAAPLLIDGVLLLTGLLMLGYGLWIKRRKQAAHP
jgi:hypothetical protein